MDYMTSITPEPGRKFFARRGTGFTLVELLISLSLSTAIMAGVMTTFLALTRTSLRLGSYDSMEGEARKGLELFGRDARMASAIVWNSATDISLTVPTAASEETYRYVYSTVARTFTRTRTAPLPAGAAQVLFSNVDGLDLKAYKINTDPVDITNLGQASMDTKQLQLTVNTSRATSTAALSTANVLSARFILRNKKVTN